MRWVGQVAQVGEKRYAYSIVVGKPEGKRPLGRPGRRWVDNIKMDLRETGWGGMKWKSYLRKWISMVYEVYFINYLPHI
jgi:hypothetical protein